MKVAILGYGRVGRGIALALRDAPDLEPVGIFTSRNPQTVEAEGGIPVYPARLLAEGRREIDVLFLAHGSKSAVADEMPRYARLYCCIDSYDVHADLPAHLSRVHEIGVRSDTLSIVGAGWDPGLFSVVRTLFCSALPRGSRNTFWGRGVSAGHSEAIGSLAGVRYAIEYTEPRADALILAEGGVTLSDTERHRRVCFVVAEPSEHARIEHEIRTMPHYFLGYETEVHFIDEQTFLSEHRARMHRGRVLSRAMTGRYRENRVQMELSLSMDDNAELTATLIVAYARALGRLYAKGVRGALSVLEIPPIALLPDAQDPATLW